MSRTPSSSSAEETAALWAARLDGSTLSTDDRRALDLWLAEEPAHRDLLSRYCQLSADLEQQLPALAGTPTIRATLADAHAARPRGQTTRRRFVWGLAAATGLAAVALTFTALIRNPGGSDFVSRVSTPIAQRQTLDLPDGSRLELNAQTALSVAFSPSERRVRLASGQAFFAVAKDLERPFYVETPTGLVRVTGTAFEVRSDSVHAFQVIVSAGSVEARPGGVGAEAFALKPGDRLQTIDGRSRVDTLSVAKLQDALAWREGQVVFEGEPLREALAQFARYHGRSLSAEPALNDMRVGGRYSLDDLDGFLNALEMDMFDPGLQVARQPHGAILIQRRP